MSNGCCTSVTSRLPSILYFSSVASSGNSVPPNHTETFRPRRSATPRMPEVLKANWRMPLKAKTWAMLTSGAPCSRAASKLGSQPRPNWAPPAATTSSGTISGPPGRMVTSRFSTA